MKKEHENMRTVSCLGFLIVFTNTLKQDQKTQAGNSLATKEELLSVEYTAKQNKN